MKKAIVTGATGGLGRNLVQTLLAQGWQVAACGRNAEIGKMLDTEFHAFDSVSYTHLTLPTILLV